MAGLLTAQPPADEVSVELRRWARLPFAWGKTDCGLSVLAYVERVTGRRIARRPAYSGRRNATDFLRRQGGFATYCASVMEELGCAPTDAPMRGDVGLLDLPAGPTACLCLGLMWAARGDCEIVLVPASARLAWRVPCPQQ